MQVAYVVGQITVKDAESWALYQSKVPSTLTQWQGSVVFRGVKVAEFAGECQHPAIVVIRFPSVAAANGWVTSADYQALIPLRTKAADVILLSYAS